jgi:hypothetical protein
MIAGSGPFGIIPTRVAALRLPGRVLSVLIATASFGARNAGTGWTARHPSHDCAARIVAGGGRFAPPPWVGP